MSSVVGLTGGRRPGRLAPVLLGAALLCILAAPAAVQAKVDRHHARQYDARLSEQRSLCSGVEEMLGSYRDLLQQGIVTMRELLGAEEIDWEAVRVEQDNYDQLWEEWNDHLKMINAARASATLFEADALGDRSNRKDPLPWFTSKSAAADKKVFRRGMAALQNAYEVLEEAGFHYRRGFDALSRQFPVVAEAEESFAKGNEDTVTGAKFADRGFAKLEQLRR